MAKTIIVFGLGWVGYWALQFLARCSGLEKIVTSDINEQGGSFKTNLAYIGSLYANVPKEFEFHRNDLNDIDATARLLGEVRPDVILFTSVLQMPHAIRENLGRKDATLTKEIAMAMKAGAMLWLPWQFSLVYKLMKAMEKAGVNIPVVNASLGDVTNTAMWRHFGFGPRVGVGNCDLLALRITHHVAKAEYAAPDCVKVYLVASYGILYMNPEEGFPHYLKIVVNDKDVTHKYDMNQLLALFGNYKLGSDPTLPFGAALPWVGASVVQKALAIANDTNEFMYANGPDGLPGGYPVRLGAKRAEVVLPPELTLEQAIKIDEAGLRLEGIERIEDDGAVVFTEETYGAMKDIGYDCKRLSLDEVELRAEELKVLYKKITGK